MVILLVVAIATTVAAVVVFLRRSQTGARPQATPLRSASVPVPDAPRIVDSGAEPTLTSTIGEARRAATRHRGQPSIAAIDEPVVDDVAVHDVAVYDVAVVDVAPASAHNTSNAVHIIDDDESLDELDLAAFGTAADVDAVDDAAAVAIVAATTTANAGGNAADASNADETPLIATPIEPASTVCVLGVPIVLGRNDLAERTIEIAVRLAVEPDGVSVDDLAGALGHGGVTEQQARSKTTTLVSRARHQLGDLDGEPLLPKISRGQPYRLHSGVVTDLTRFEQLVDSAAQLPPSDAIEALRAALEMVRGRPFGEAPYVWAINDGWVGRAHEVVSEAALRLAELALAADDPTTVWFAINKGLLAIPDDEQLLELLATAVDRETRR